MFRFFDTRQGSHFYTASAAERDFVLANFSEVYALEGSAFFAADEGLQWAAPVYRFFRKQLGTHFYTASAAERDAVRANLSDHYAYEGVGFSAAAGPQEGCEAVYRFFHKTLGTHFYTASAAERDFVNAHYGAAYLNEGVAYYVPTTREADPYQ